MIIINKNNVIENKDDLLLFFDYMDNEVYDDNTTRINDTIQDFLEEVFDRTKLVNMSLHERISEDLVAYAIIEFDPAANYRETEVRLFSKTEDYKLKENDKLVFDGIVDRHFKGLKSLWDRFTELDIK